MTNIKTINFLGLRKVFFGLAIVLMLASIASLVVKQLNLGLDFTGGALVELNYSQPADLEEIRGVLRESGWNDAVVQNFGASTDVLIRLPSENPDLGAEIAQLVKRQDGNDVSVKRVEFIGPQVGEELRDKGGLGNRRAVPRRDLHPWHIFTVRSVIRSDGAGGPAGGNRLFAERYYRCVRPGAGEYAVDASDRVDRHHQHLDHSNPGAYPGNLFLDHSGAPRAVLVWR